MFSFAGLQIHVLRDDLLAGGGPSGGNKARKLSIFRRVALPYSRLISYGSAQSNAMAALADLARANAQQLVFFAARSAPNIGNLAYARNQGAWVIFASELDNYAVQTAAHESALGHLEYASELVALANKSPKNLAQTAHRLDRDGFFIPEGAAIYEARFGAYEQSRDLLNFAASRGLSGKNTAIFLPSGTGASAAWLAHFCPSWRVFSTDVAKPGEAQKFAQQMGIAQQLRMLQTKRKFAFAQLHSELFNTLKEVESASLIKFELLYDAKGFLCLKEHAKWLLQQGISDIIYVHQGGLLGDVSMQKRYEDALLCSKSERM